MILQLLQEGALSQPPHVYNEALEFVIDLLDPTAVQVQSQPKGLLQVLPSLIKQGESTRHCERILGLIEKFKESRDEYTIFQLYVVLSELVDSDTFSRAVRQYEGPSQDILASVRLRWPSLWGKDVSAIAQEPGYWDGVSEEIWAETLWESFLEGKQSRPLSTPAHLHQLLIEQFAANPRPIVTGRTAQSMTLSSGDLAVWHLLKAQKALIDSFMLRGEIKPPILDDNVSSNLSGLERSTGQTVSALIELTKRLLENFDVSEAARKDALSNYLGALRHYLRAPGIDGWLACRCVTNLVQITLSAEFNMRRTRESQDARSKFAISLKDRREWRELIDGMAELFNTDSRNVISQLRNDSFVYGFYDEYIGISSAMIPTHVRLAVSDPAVAVTDLLSKNICRNEQLPPWVTRIPISRGMIRPLVGSCLERLPELLRFFSQSRFNRFGPGAPLMVQQMQRILKVIKSTDDQDLLAGALRALTDSTFLQLASLDLIEKMLSAEVGQSRVVSLLFDSSNTDPHIARGKDIAVINKIANRVLANPQAFSFRTVIDSAKYVAEHSVVNTLPLMSEEEKLGIFFQQSTTNRTLN
jgi:hypothetical protein